MNWVMEFITTFLRGLENGFKELDRGRLKVSKIRTKDRWVLSSDIWPLSGGNSKIQVCSRVDKKGWLDSYKMWKSSLTKANHIRWFANKSPTSKPPSESKSLSYANSVISGGDSMKSKERK